MNTDLMARKLTELRQRPSADQAAIDAIEYWFQQSDVFQRMRSNPFTIASDTQSNVSSVIRELLYGVYIGLFDLHWDVHCPHCYMITEEHDDLADLTGPSACPMCEMDFEADFVHRVEVTFSFTKAIEDLRLPPLCEPPATMQARFPLGASQNETVRTEDILEEGTYRYFCPVTMSKGLLHVSGEWSDEVQELHITQLEGNVFDPPELTARPGRIAISLTNVGHPFSGLYVTQNELPMLSPDDLPLYLSGLQLIHYPEFRVLFGNQVLSDRERLQIASVTTIFTDITGSTQMYDKLGDAVAYNIVRDHFDILFRVIEQNNGRIVKTIGDAVMASFIANEHAIRSILDFLKGLDRYNQGRSDDEQVYLKIGIHRGPAILVNLNGRLDYFGSTINKAARIQGLSRSGEISLSDEVYLDETSMDLLHKAGLDNATRHTVNLKGIEGEQTVYKVAGVSHGKPHSHAENFLSRLFSLGKRG